MSEVVLDSSVVLKWFRSDNERHLAASRQLRRRFEQGELRVLVPPLLFLEILNVAARKWDWDERKLAQLAATLPELRFEVVKPALESIALWASRGLTAYDATYIAVAEDSGTKLVTDDTGIQELAPAHSTALGS